MRKLIVCNIMSVDGFVEGHGKNVMDVFDYRWTAYPNDDSFDVYNAERLREADTLLLGRTTYDQFRGYWPPIADDATKSKTEREISQLNNAIRKVVVSDSLRPAQTDPWRSTTTIIPRKQAESEITRLKQGRGKDILTLGSRTLWNRLLARGLVDEIHLMIGPVVLGQGTPAFDGRPPVSLRLVDARTWTTGGTVLARYRVNPTAAGDGREISHGNRRPRTGPTV